MGTPGEKPQADMGTALCALCRRCRRCRLFVWWVESCLSAASGAQRYLFIAWFSFPVVVCSAAEGNVTKTRH